MNWIDFAWPMMGGACLALALIHLLIWARHRSQPVNLVFCLIALTVAVLAACELMMMRSVSSAQFADLLRWASIPASVTVILLVVFVLMRYHAGRPWLGFAAGALQFAGSLPNLAAGTSLPFATISALQPVGVWGPHSVSAPVGEPSAWMLLSLAGSVLLLLFLAGAMIEIRRREETRHARQKALLVCASVMVFVAVGGIWGAAVVLGWLDAPYIVNLPFLGVVAVMSYELSGNVFESSELARRLQTSEARLRESEQRVQLAAESGGLGLWTWNRETGEFWLTDTSRQLLGLRPEQRFDWKRALAAVLPEDRETVMRAWNDATHGGGEYVCEFRLPRQRGGMRWLAARGRATRGGAGAPDLLRGVIFDVSQRRQAEERFRLVIDAAPNAMLMIDAEGRVVLANTQVERVFGYSRAELLEMPVDDLVPERFRPGQAEHPRAFYLEQEPRGGMARNLFGRRRDGTDIPMEVGLNPLWISGMPYVLASVNDISERLRLEAETDLQREELAHLSRVAMLGEMSGSLAHELNQPLTAILSNAQAALRFMKQDPFDIEEVRESLVHIVENDKRAGEVIRRLRAMLRKERVPHNRLDINDVVQDGMRLVASDMLNRNVAVSLALAPDLPAIDGDRVQLQQVLLNLAINACDAMNHLASGRLLTIRTGMAAQAGVQVSVADVGRGIPPDELERIFQPFVTDKPEGMGLGLPVCQSIIQAHGGKLWATNNEDRGATMHFVLPLAGTSPAMG